MRLRSLGAKVTQPVSAGRPADPAALLERAGQADRVALARLLSYIERGGATAMAVARLAYRSDVPYTVGLTGAPGAGKSTLTDGRSSARRGRVGPGPTPRRSRRWASWPSTRPRPSAGGRSWATACA